MFLQVSPAVSHIFKMYLSKAIASFLISQNIKTLLSLYIVFIKVRSGCMIFEFFTPRNLSIFLFSNI